MSKIDVRTEVEISCHKPHCRTTRFYLLAPQNILGVRCRCKPVNTKSLTVKFKLFLKEEKESEPVARSQLTIKLPAPFSTTAKKIIIDELYVVSKFRRLHLGSRLLSTIIASFGGPGVVEVVPRPFGHGEKLNLEDLKKFYEKFGFRLGLAPTTGRTPSPVMICKLS